MWIIQKWPRAGGFCPQLWGSDENQRGAREFDSHCRGLLIVGSHGQKGNSFISMALWFSSPREYRAGTSSWLSIFLSAFQALRRQVTHVPIICVLRFGHPLYSGTELFSVLTGHERYGLEPAQWPLLLAFLTHCSWKPLCEAKWCVINDLTVRFCGACLHSIRFFPLKHELKTQISQKTGAKPEVKYMPILYNGIQNKTIKMQNTVLCPSRVRLNFLFSISALFIVILRGRKMHQKHFSF